ncbi:MAG: hypothetical protein PWR12_314 [Eubacteriaceae bacterium]|nr:hypothetical protein [Eubacteriaceae bacterium]
MTSLAHYAVNFNTKLKVSFDGGDLSSDAGLLVPRSFDEKLGLSRLIEAAFPATGKHDHPTADIVRQLMYTTIAGYHTDDASDRLRLDPAFTQILGKKELASQPSVSRRLNEFDDRMLKKLDQLLLDFIEKAYSVNQPKHVVLDIDSTHIDTHGHQENSAFNYHYKTTGYHPLMLFDGLTGDLLKVELRKGSVYTSNNVVAFLEPVLQWFRTKFPTVELILRGDSGFATPDLYELLESYDVHYVIRLKLNAALTTCCQSANDEFFELYGHDYTKCHNHYDAFHYQAGSWTKSRRVAVRIERHADEFYPRHTFIVTDLSLHPQEIIKIYHKRGQMENFIKEAKLDFGMETLSHSSFLTNSVKLLIRALAYNLINLMRHLVLPKSHQKSRLLTLRTTLFKVAGRLTRSGRSIQMKFSSSFPYLDLLRDLLVKLE